jgi:hypothetical protein
MHEYSPLLVPQPPNSVKPGQKSGLIVAIAILVRQNIRRF